MIDRKPSIEIIQKAKSLMKTTTASPPRNLKATKQRMHQLEQLIKNEPNSERTSKRKAELESLKSKFKDASVKQYGPIKKKRATAVVVHPKLLPSNMRPKMGTQVAPPTPAMAPFIKVFGSGDPLAKFKDRKIKEVVSHLNSNSLDQLLDILFKRLRLDTKHQVLQSLFDSLIFTLPDDLDKAAESELKKLAIYEIVHAGVINGSRQKVQAALENLRLKFKKKLG